MFSKRSVPLVEYPNGAVAPFDPNVAVATANHYAAKVIVQENWIRVYSMNLNVAARVYCLYFYVLARVYSWYLNVCGQSVYFLLDCSGQSV